MDKHTPGPWTFSEWGVGAIGIYSRERHVIANITSRAVTKKELNQANARLIAAAPRLLEALRKVVLIADEYCVAHNTQESGCIAQARAAIKEATGGA